MSLAEVEAHQRRPEIRFFVAGIPRPGGSKRVFPIRKGGQLTGKFIVTDAAGQANKDWRASVAHEAQEAFKEGPLSGPIKLELQFVMPRPKAHFATSLRNNGSLKPQAPRFHLHAPDVLKLARGTIDAMTQILYRDDSQIIKETHEKAYGSQPGCWVIMREAGN